jgi:ribonucleoside-diphosphate reductase alpha chain
VERSKMLQETQEKLKQNELEITKSDGSKELFDIEKIRNTYKRVSFGLARTCKFEELEASLNKYVVEGMKTKDILKMMIKSCIDLVTVENIQWEKIAGRLMMIDLYKESTNNRKMALKDIYSPESFKSLVDDYIAA